MLDILVPLQKIPLEEDYVYPIYRDVEASFQSFKSGNEILVREIETQDPMVIPFMFRLKRADLRLRKLIVLRDCVVERGALFPPTPRVASGGG